jgi:hypothetical protein
MMTKAITRVTPVLRIDSRDEAVGFYVDWLGFNLDWEWRETPGGRAIVAISRDGVSIMLNESPDRSSASWLSLDVDDIDGFAAEWNARRPGSVEVVVEAPYEIPTISLRDASGNRLDFAQPISDEEQAARDARVPRMREYTRQKLAESGVFPTPEQIVEAVGGPPGLAIEVLNQFREYGGSPPARRGGPGA